jgi:hypothetical protein
LYGYETWYHILWEKHRLKGFENREFKEIFSLQSGEVREGCRKMHDELRMTKINNLKNLLCRWRIYYNGP